MLNRRILRIKAFKVVYGYAVTGNLSQDRAKKLLEDSCEAVRDLYLLLLLLPSALTGEAASRIEAARGKFNPTKEELNPNETFVRNALVPFLGEDPDFKKIIQNKKLSWERFDIFIRDLFDTVSSRAYYKNYMEKGDSSLKASCRLFGNIFEKELEDNSALGPILEDLSILWNDDLAYALTWCCRSLSNIASGKAWKLPELYQSEMILKEDPSAKVSSDRDFAAKLVRTALAGYDGYFEKVTSLVPEWDRDRLFSSDMAIIACAMAEIENFPDIPDKVSLNEYVEIAKFYCSPKSAGFINGILDRLIKETV